MDHAGGVQRAARATTPDTAFLYAPVRLHASIL